MPSAREGAGELPGKYFYFSIITRMAGGILLRVMRRTLLEHITDLEQKIEVLRTRMKEAGRSEAELSQWKIDLGIAERSLVYYRKAFDLEQKISG